MLGNWRQKRRGIFLSWPIKSHALSRIRALLSSDGGRSKKDAKRNARFASIWRSHAFYQSGITQNSCFFGPLNRSRARSAHHFTDSRRYANPRIGSYERQLRQKQIDKVGRHGIRCHRIHLPNAERRFLEVLKKIIIIELRGVRVATTCNSTTEQTTFIGKQYYTRIWSRL